MKKLISAILIFIFTFAVVGVCSVSAEGKYTQPDKFIYGDVNQDLEVNVKDVTYIQKGLAEIHYVNAVQRFLADPEGEGFSIKNATAIQKYLAKYEVSPLLGTELPMASQDEFSNLYSESLLYDFSVIEIVPKKSMGFSHQYTLEDFPEFDFSHIEVYGSIEKGYMFYDLYLSEPTEENLIKALKALDYRANIDIEIVCLNSSSKPA